MIQAKIMLQAIGTPEQACNHAHEADQDGAAVFGTTISVVIDSRLCVTCFID
jgi:hypothetical protein